MPEVCDAPPELFHYTTWGALFKIIESQQLWATHYKHLNDTTEVVHFKRYLVDAVAEAFCQRLLKSADPAVAAALQKIGDADIVSRDEARKIIESMYEVAFTGSTIGPPLSVPFICSFCSHASHTPYEKENGLLSLWRSYGGEAGYALVFDCGELENLTKREFTEYAYQARVFEPVVYDEGVEKFKARHKKLTGTITDGVWQFLIEGKKWEMSVEMVTEFLVGTITFKHRGFKEEDEVRIAMCPTPHASREQTRVTNPTDESLKKSPKQVHNRGQIADIFYIKLFDFTDRSRLPIKRIVVGPHREQAALKARVLELVGDKIPVFCSQTPYVGRIASAPGIAQ